MRKKSRDEEDWGAHWSDEIEPDRICSVVDRDAWNYRFWVQHPERVAGLWTSDPMPDNVKVLPDTPYEAVLAHATWMDLVGRHARKNVFWRLPVVLIFPDQVSREDYMRGFAQYRGKELPPDVE